MLFQRSLIPISLLCLLAPSASTNLDAEIASLSKDLSIEKADSDFVISLDRRFIDELASKFAHSSQEDLTVKIFPSRLFSFTSDLGITTTQNYLDITSGSGSLNIKEARIISISNGRINTYLSLSGKLRSTVQGKYFGFGYTAEPDIRVVMQEHLPLCLETAGKNSQLRPTAKTLTAKVDFSLPISVLGTNLDTARELQLNAASLLKPVSMPSNIKFEKISIENITYTAEQGKLKLHGKLSLTIDKNLAINDE
ncbi:MAG: hypothetical protein RMM17_06775 [Acidobacteriota bacterium]|nr:hypothetical protein [Blastocatellia bacterium]MDW8412367.1 hypothetical protein [Acidobacteriota bacterium]